MYMYIHVHINTCDIATQSTLYVHCIYVYTCMYTVTMYMYIPLASVPIVRSRKMGFSSSAQFKHVRNGEGLEPRLHVYDIAITVAVYSTYIIM